MNCKYYSVISPFNTIRQLYSTLRNVIDILTEISFISCDFCQTFKFVNYWILIQCTKILKNLMTHPLSVMFFMSFELINCNCQPSKQLI